MTKFKREFNFDENIIKTIAYNVIKYRKLNNTLFYLFFQEKLYFFINYH